MGEAFDPQDKLGYIDRGLQNIIKAGDMPFLGLYSKLLDEKIHNAININLKKSRDPLRQYLVYLDCWPAISLIYLTIHVCKGFGSHGTFEVYPFIQDALQLPSTLTTSQKDKLWKAYRTSCIKLGLSISTRLSGAHFMVDEYLRQSGVPIPYVDDLTDRMLRYGKVVGIPDDDDPAAIKRWQDGLSLRLLLPFSKVARQAIVIDDNGYYIRLFLKLLDKPADPATALSDFELRMSDAIHKQQITAVLRRKGKSLSIAQILWRDNQLGVELPPGEGTEWAITIGDVTINYIGQIESRFVPFDNPLPPSVEIMGKEHGSRFKTKLWEDDKNNRLLIFSPSGAFVHASKLNEEPLTLEPGDYQVVLRFIPDGLNETIEEVRRHPSLYLLLLRLEPGQKVLLSHGPATIELHVDQKPILLWDGVSIKGIRGNEVYCGNDLQLRALIPDEFFVDGAKYYVRFSQSTVTEVLTAELSSHQQGAISIDVSKLIGNNWKSGVTRVLAEMYREGIQRPIFRSSIMVWLGLATVKNRTHFYCTSLPDNLIEGECDNLFINRDQIFLSYRNEDNKYFRLVFDLDDMKRFIFTLPVPGIFMQLKDYSISTEFERPLKKGATISIARNSRSVLEISSTSNGVLRLGSFNKHVDFGNCGSKRLPLSGLVEYLGPEADTLQFLDETTGGTESLLHLVSPHEVTGYSVTHRNKMYTIQFFLAQEALEVSMRSTDLLSGICDTLFLGCNCTFERAESGVNGWLTCEHDAEQGLYRHELMISLDRWPNGAWIIDLEAKMNERWGNFSNARGDKYSSGFVMLDGMISTNAIPVMADIQAAGFEEKLEILQRVNEKLLSCYALESWHELNWLESVWQLLLDEFKEQNNYAPKLLYFSEQHVPEETSCSWIPMRTLSAYFPGIYTLPARYYADIPSTDSILIKCLTVMTRMEYGLLPLFHEAVLNQVFAVGYLNVLRMMQGDEPCHFNMGNYKDALKRHDLTDRMRLLKQDDWMPGEGDYLGALHYLFASGKLEESYRATMSGNEHRRGKALFLCHSMQNFTIPGLPTHLGTGMTHLGFINLADEENLSVEQDFILQISNFLFLFAKVCRWETREPGNLVRFIKQAKYLVEDTGVFESVFGYLLYIGKEIFGFYLLLWEAILRSDYNTGESNVYIRKQSSGSLGDAESNVAQVYSNHPAYQQTLS